MRITVFTPTYNRAYTIKNLYCSLQRQTFLDFEWLVIDDGSSDETKALFDSWRKESNPFPIRYYYEENKGKMKEINRAMDWAEGDLFFTVDSDDILTPDALEKIDCWERQMPHDGSFCGLAGNAEYSDKHSKNPIFSHPYIDATLFQRYRDNGQEHIGFDRAWVFYTDIYRRYKFPEFDGEKFIAEAVSWNRMAHDGLKIRCFNDVLSLYIQDADGLTHSISKTLIKSPRGYGLWKFEQMKFLDYSFLRKLKEYYIFYCDLIGEYSWQDIAEFIHAPKYIMFLIHIVYYIKHGGVVRS